MANASPAYLKRYGLVLFYNDGCEFDDSCESEVTSPFLIDTDRRIATMYCGLLPSYVGYYTSCNPIGTYLNLYQVAEYQKINQDQYVRLGATHRRLTNNNLLHFLLSVGKSTMLVTGELAISTYNFGLISSVDTIVVAGIAGNLNGEDHIRLCEKNIYDLWNDGAIHMDEILKNTTTPNTKEPQKQVAVCSHCGKKLTKRNTSSAGDLCKRCYNKLYVEIDGCFYEKKRVNHCIATNTYHRYVPSDYTFVCVSEEYQKKIAPIEWAIKNCHNIGGSFYYKYLPEINKFGYHEVKRTIKGSENKPLIGFEVEKSRGSDDFFASDILLKHGWIKERDGSLPDDGFELVSPAFNIDHDFKKEFEKIKDLLDLPVNSSCGGHINLSFPNMRPRKMFEQISGFVPLLLSMYSGRLNNEYCCENIHKNNDKDDHYSAICLHENRVEFRLISAVKNTEQLLWRARLFELIVNYKTDSVSDVIKMCCNAHHEIHKHLRKIYSHETLKQRLILAKEYAFSYDYATRGEVIDVEVQKTRITNKNIEP